MSKATHKIQGIQPRKSASLSWACLLGVAGILVLSIMLQAHAQANTASEQNDGIRGSFREHVQKNIHERRADKTQNRDRATSEDLVTLTYQGRDILVYVPHTVRESAKPALVVVLHGGGGSASFMQSHLKMEDVAQERGFIVSYLNGTDVSDHLPSKMRAWNSGGGCCGKPADDNVDDVSYITSAVSYLKTTYNIDPSRIYAVGHSNGSMMSQLMVCTTDVFKAGVTISAPLTMDVRSCPAAHGKHLLAIHGEDDQNAPVNGGQATKGPNRVQHEFTFRSEESAKELFEHSGASYALELLPNIDHSLEHINQYYRTKGQSLAIHVADFFGL